MEQGKPKSRLDKGRHIKYWLRCLKTLLPSLYTSNDSNRMYLAYFILSALDILDNLEKSTSESERAGYVDWIYHCQHHGGGFRMWPGTDLGEHTNEENAKWDPANIPATYFALCSLLILGDNLHRVKRKEALSWLNNMQRPDGSFAETLVDGELHGGRDPRFGYCALGVRYILRGGVHVSKDDEISRDVDLDSFVKCVQISEAYDGGIADEPFHEPHSGYTFCSLGAVAFIDRLNTGQPNSNTQNGNKDLVTAPQYPAQVLRWLVERQTDFVDPDCSLDSEFANKMSLKKPNEKDKDKAPKTLQVALSEADDLHQSPDKSTLWSSGSGAPAVPPLIAGMNGRQNKVADTCYAWWVAASVHILGQPDAIQNAGLRLYLLELTQHQVMGAFTKFPGDKWADLYHGYLGLAALSLCSTKEERESEGLKRLDAGMCVSKDVRDKIDGLWKS